MHRPPHPHSITDHRQVNLVFDDTVSATCIPFLVYSSGLSDPVIMISSIDHQSSLVRPGGRLRPDLAPISQIPSLASRGCAIRELRSLRRRPDAGEALARTCRIQLSRRNRYRHRMKRAPALSIHPRAPCHPPNHRPDNRHVAAESDRAIALLLFRRARS